MKRITTQLTYLSFLILSGNLLAEPITSEEFKPYKVEVSSVAAMFEHMKKHGLSDQNDYQFHGGSSWKISWTYQTKVRRSRCYLKKLKVRVKATHKTPELSAPLKNAVMQETWDNYNQALLKHQNKHIELAVASATTIEKEIKNIKKPKNCDEFGPLVNDIYENILLENKTKNQRLDAKTDLGRKDGATFDSFIHGEE